MPWVCVLPLPPQTTSQVDSCLAIILERIRCWIPRACRGRGPESSPESASPSAALLPCPLALHAPLLKPRRLLLALVGPCLGSVQVNAKAGVADGETTMRTVQARGHRHPLSLPSTCILLVKQVSLFSANTFGFSEYHCFQTLSLHFQKLGCKGILPRFLLSPLVQFLFIWCTVKDLNLDLSPPIPRNLHQLQAVLSQGTTPS